MHDFLFRKFIRNYEDVKNPEVRDQYGKVAGIVGILSNTLLCVMKIAAGLLSGSIAIVADAVNNLADASSSLITLIGFKLAAMPEDKEHPYGHARIEYLAGLLVSVIIIVVGLELGKSSVEKFLSPSPVSFSALTAVILVLGILCKLFMFWYNRRVGRHIDSDYKKRLSPDICRKPRNCVRCVQRRKDFFYNCFDYYDCGAFYLSL